MVVLQEVVLHLTAMCGVVCPAVEAKMTLAVSPLIGNEMIYLNTRRGEY